MIRTPLRPLARILDARAQGVNPKGIERENLRLRREQARDAGRRRAEWRLLLLAALFSDAFMGFASRFRKHLGRVEKAMGAMLVAAGIAFLTGAMQSFSFWLLETFPVLGTLG